MGKKFVLLQALALLIAVYQYDMGAAGQKEGRHSNKIQSYLFYPYLTARMPIAGSGVDEWLATTAQIKRARYRVRRRRIYRWCRRLPLRTMLSQKLIGILYIACIRPVRLWILKMREKFVLLQALAVFQYGMGAAGQKEGKQSNKILGNVLYIVRKPIAGCGVDKWLVTTARMNDTSIHVHRRRIYLSCLRLHLWTMFIGILYIYGSTCRKARTIWFYCTDKVYHYRQKLKSVFCHTLIECGALVTKMLLMISGDVESNPGPGLDQVTQMLPSVDDSPLGEQDLLDILEEMMPLVARWKAIGRGFRIDSGRLDQIQADNHGDCQECLAAVLTCWLRKNYDVQTFGEPTWKMVVKVVAHPVAGNNCSLAMSIAGRHSGKCQEEQDPPTRGSASHPAAQTVGIEDCHVQTQEGLLEEIAESLRSRYQFQPEVQEDCWPPVKKCHFIDLALLKNESIDFSDDFARHTVRGSVDQDDIIKAKERVHYSCIFEKVKAGSRILLEGRPGSGKTTLMNKIRRDWAQREILKGSVSLLILIPLHKLCNEDEVTLKTMLSVSDIPDSKAPELLRYIESHDGEGVCLALDGLDEFSSRKDDCVCQLIDRRQLCKSIVVVASRPKAIQKFRQVADQDIEVLGFPKEQIEKYISDNVESNEMAKNMKLYLDHHPNIMHMCYLPIHMAIVTFLFNKMGSNLPDTETEIYRQFTLQTLIKALLKSMKEDEPNVTLERFEDLPPEEHQLFLNVCELALTATTNQKQGIVHKEVEQLFTLTKQHGRDTALGLMTVDRQATLHGPTNTYSFLHLTFQEFLAACHLTTLSKERQLQFISNDHKQPHMEVVYRFYCGLTRLKDDTALRSFVSTIDTITFWGGPAHTRLLHLHCAYESQNEVAIQAMVSAGRRTIFLNNENLNPSDCTAIGFVIDKSGGQLQTLRLRSCHIASEGLETLASRNLSCLKTLDLCGCSIGEPGAIAVAESLRFCGNLQELVLGCNEIGGEGCAALSRGLQKCRKLQKLHLSVNKIGGEGCAVLSRGLQECRELQELYLGRCSIGDSGAIAVAESLRFWGNLQKLNLILNAIASEGCAALSRGLQECRELDLSLNEIGDEGCAALSRGLQECRELQGLHLIGCSIGDSGATALAACLRSCVNLQKLYLGMNSLTDASVKSIAQLITTVKSLKYLGLWGNTFTEGGKTQLQQAAEERKCYPDFVKFNLTFVL